MSARAADVAAVTLLATILVLAVAAPVLRAPSERIIGMAIVGRHHDPFTVMEQFERPIGVGVYSQPLTDVPGALIARITGPVAAYNWLVLLSFPLSAAAAYLLGRQLALSRPASVLAAIAFAFSPFHLAHAAYHPQIAQTQWLPLYFLALWRCLDDASTTAVALLGAAAIGVTLSNFYGGLIAAVLTPLAIAAYWLFVRRHDDAFFRPLVATLVTLLFIVSAGAVYVSYVAPAVLATPRAFGFPRDDLFRFSARWWSYLVPPVAHPLLGRFAARIWSAAGVREGLLEQQVSLGWGLTALAAVAVVAWLTRRGKRPALAMVPVLATVAAGALVCSLSPERVVGPITFVRPSALLYGIVPMFRSYARFGVIVQLMTALLAGIGAQHLWRVSAIRGRIACVALIVLTAGEYAVWPPAMWRDVLPTAAHRWVTRQAGYVHALDCAPLTTESASVQWLTNGRVSLEDGRLDDCLEPNLAGKLAAFGFTHLLLRRDSPDGRWLATRPPPDGFNLAARFDDGEVFAVAAAAPPVYTAGMEAFSGREFDAASTWRWMGHDASWTIVNEAGRPLVASLAVQMSAFQGARRLRLLLDGRPIRTLTIGQQRGVDQLGSFALAPGAHTLTFQPVDPPIVADDALHNGDHRVLSFAFGGWHWTIA